MNARADISGAVPAAVTRDESRAVFGQVMGFVALTLGFSDELRQAFRSLGLKTNQGATYVRYG